MKKLLLLLSFAIIGVLSSCEGTDNKVEEVVANIKLYKVMNVATHEVSIAKSEEPVNSGHLWIFTQGDTIIVNVRSGYIKPTGKTMKCVVVDYIN